MTNVRILIAEDEGIVAMDLQNMLKSFGYCVAGVVSSGGEAVKKAEELRPDLVLMDIGLKGDISGGEAAKRIHAHLHIPVVYLTGYLDKVMLQQIERGEAFGYIVKPFEERELRTIIEMVLSKYKAI